jgi:hypothetical protein
VGRCQYTCILKFSIMIYWHYFRITQFYLLKVICIVLYIFGAIATHGHAPSFYYKSEKENDHRAPRATKSTPEHTPNAAPENTTIAVVVVAKTDRRHHLHLLRYYPPPVTGRRRHNRLRLDTVSYEPPPPAGSQSSFCFLVDLVRRMYLCTSGHGSGRRIMLPYPLR